MQRQPRKSCNNEDRGSRKNFPWRALKGDKPSTRGWWSPCTKGKLQNKEKHREIKHVETLKKQPNDVDEAWWNLKMKNYNRTQQQCEDAKIR